MRTALEGKGKGRAQLLVVPPAPHAAVLKGAVVFGMHPDLIRARRARLSYGVETCSPYVRGDPESLKFWHKEEAMFYTKSRFRPFVLKNQLVSS